jgi:uroporphyrinogen-III synthase
MMKKALIWTRAREYGEEDASLLERVPVPVIYYPAIYFVPISWSLPRHVADVVTITSKKAVSILEASSSGKSYLESAGKIVVFGRSTYDQLRAMGLTNVEWDREADSARELGVHLGAKLKRGSRVICFGPKQPSFELADYLFQRGLAAAEVPLYETIVSQKESLELTNRLRTLDQVWVALTSPSSALGFRNALGGSYQSQKSRMVALAIGGTTAKNCEGLFDKVIRAPSPVIADFIDFCRQTILQGEKVK